MPNFLRKIVIPFSIFMAIFGLLYHVYLKHTEKITAEKSDQRINMVSIICGDEYFFSTFLTMLKSALVFQISSPLHIIILCEDKFRDRIAQTLDGWWHTVDNKFSYEIRGVTHREIETDHYICTMDRLYLPELLPQLDKVLYIDADTLVLKDLSDIWQQFHLMNSSQLCGVAWNNFNMKTSLYKKMDHVPVYEIGFNAGILLMDLKKMREFNWIQRAQTAIEKYRKTLYGLDQDIVNIIFHDNPDRFYLLPCRFNLQTVYFEATDGICKDAVVNAPTILHACGGIYRQKRDDNYPFVALSRVQDAFREYELGTDPLEYLVKPLKKKLAEAPDNVCTHFMRLYLDDVNFFSIKNES